MEELLTKLLENILKERNVLFREAETALLEEDFDKFNTIAKYLFKIDKNSVWLLKEGPEDDWRIISIHKTKPGAELAKMEYEKPQKSRIGTTVVLEADIEEWELSG